jgi:hypothetical protein
LQGGFREDRYESTEWDGEVSLGAVRLVQECREWWKLCGGLLGPDGAEMTLHYGSRRLTATATLKGGEEVRLTVRPA